MKLNTIRYALVAAALMLASSPALAADMQYKYPMPSGTAWSEPRADMPEGRKAEAHPKREALSQYPTGKAGKRQARVTETPSQAENDTPVQRKKRSPRVW